MSEIKTLEEQNIRFEQKQNDWLEPMKEWINEAANAAKIARDTNLFNKRFSLQKSSARTLSSKTKKRAAARKINGRR